MGFITSLLHALDLAFDMAWDTWWALVLGFTITGAVEVFVSEEKMMEYLGDDDWREVGYGTLFGVLSSSCSYSAISTAKTLFKKGASPVAAFAAFMFAATDLVVEIGLVMWILLGWKFVFADFLGGVFVILILTFIYRRVPDRWWDVAYENVLELDETQCAACGMAAPPHEPETVVAEHDGETLHFCCGGCENAWEAMNDAQAERVDGSTPGLLSKHGWKQAATNAVKEWDMLWDDIAIGFLIAGIIAGFVPRTWWIELFNTGSSGFLWVVYGAVIGVAIAVATFICSVGNIPFALVLWSNGLPFGAVLSFIYADMVIPPIVNAYRKYYGLRIAVVMFLSMAFASVAGGVLVHYVFDLTGLIPPQGQSGGTAPDGYTTALNLLFTVLFLAQVTVAYGRDTVGNWMLDAVGYLGDWYWKAEQQFGTATENYRRFKRFMAVVAEVLGTAATAAGDVAESTAENLEETADEIDEARAKKVGSSDAGGASTDAQSGADPRREAREAAGVPAEESADASTGESADAAEESADAAEDDADAAEDSAPEEASDDEPNDADDGN